MSVNDMIKKSVLNSFSQYNVPKMALALLVALSELVRAPALPSVTASSATQAVTTHCAREAL